MLLSLPLQACPVQLFPWKFPWKGKQAHLADEEVGEARLERLAEEAGLLQDGVVRVEDLVQVVHVVRCGAQHTEGASGSVHDFD